MGGRGQRLAPTTISRGIHAYDGAHQPQYGTAHTADDIASKIPESTTKHTRSRTTPYKTRIRKHYTGWGGKKRKKKKSTAVRHILISLSGSYPAARSASSSSLSCVVFPKHGERNHSHRPEQAITPTKQTSVCRELRSKNPPFALPPLPSPEQLPVINGKRALYLAPGHIATGRERDGSPRRKQCCMIGDPTTDPILAGQNKPRPSGRQNFYDQPHDGGRGG